MANHACDLSLTTGLDDGTTWANAFKTIASMVAGIATGDTIWLKGQASQAGDPAAAVTVTAPDIETPTYLIGVKEATTNEPGSVVASDLVPGFLTGDSTRAYDQTSGNAAPIIENTGASGEFFWGQAWWLYGIVHDYGDSGRFNQTDGHIRCYECHFKFAQTTSGSDLIIAGNVTDMNEAFYFSCKFTNGNSTSSFILIASTSSPWLEMYDMVYDPTNTSITKVSDAGSGSGGNILFHGCDFSLGTSLTAVFDNFTGSSNTSVIGCKGVSGIGIGVSNRPGGRRFSDGLGPNPGSPLGIGESSTDSEWSIWNGNITMETVAVRTGGASDGADGAYSWSLTPHTGETVPYYLPLFTPWIMGWIEGDGTSKTVTIFFAHDGTGDHNDDEVELEILYPSEDGNITGARKTTKINLLATPAAIATDASTWGGSAANNGQKLSLTIAPNYSGPIMARILMQTGGTETMFVDPKLDIV